MRINKFLANCGIDSRRKVEKLILDRLVSVNGEVISNLATEVSEEDIVQVAGRQVYYNTKKIYIMLNKPKGYVTTVSDQFNRPTVLHLVDSFNTRLFPVGRLDYDSRGLLILTNDGDFANKMIHPSKKVAKTYEVITKKDISISNMKKLQSGVEIDGKKTAPCKLVKLGVLDRFFLFKITIIEGRNRQVRKMFESIENEVLELKRTKIGKLELGNLKEGKFRHLNENEIALLLQ